MDRRQQTAAAAERYRDTTRERREVKRRQKAEGTRVVDTPERVRARATRLVQAGKLSPEAVMQALLPGEAVEPMCCWNGSSTRPTTRRPLLYPAALRHHQLLGCRGSRIRATGRRL